MILHCYPVGMMHYYRRLPPEYLLLIKVLEQAHRDKCSRDERLRTDAQEFLQWARVVLAGELPTGR